MKRQKGRKCFLLFQAFFNSWKARAVQPSPQHLFLFHCPHTCFAGASFRRVLQKKRQTKKFSARPRFSSLPSAVLSCGLLKPCWLPPQPAETSGGCSYQVTNRSSLTDQFIPVSIAIENFTFTWKILSQNISFILRALLHTGLSRQMHAVSVQYIVHCIIWGFSTISLMGWILSFLVHLCLCQS